MRIKPHSPRWRPGRAPAGTRLYLPFHDRGGPPRDVSPTRRATALVGAPAWQSGPYGPRLGGFTTSDYASADGTQILGAAYPCWVAILASNTSTTVGVPVLQGQAASTVPLWGLGYNSNGQTGQTVGQLAYIVRNDNGTAVSPVAGGLPISDGLPHVAMGISYSTTDHRLYWDGAQVATSTGEVTSLPCDLLSLGVMRRGGTIQHPLGGSLSAVALGYGYDPDFRALADDWISGTFAAVRPRRSLSLLMGEPPASELALSEPADAGCVDVASSSVDDGTSTITLHPRRTYDAKWWHYYATITGTLGRTLTLDIERANAWNALIDTCRHGFYSYEGVTWHGWDSQTFVASPSNRIRFEKTTPFTEDTVHVAYYPVYTAARVVSRVAEWKLSEFVHPTDSGDADLIIGSTASRSNGFGRTCPAADIHGFRIEDESEVGSKNVCLLTGGNHPGEHNAIWALDEAIELLLSADPRAVFLREHWVFYCYPDTNPQGRYGGLFRNAPDALSEDYNRIWDATDSGTQVTVKDAILADIDAAGINAYLDFHSYNHEYGNGTDLLDSAFATDQDAGQNPAFAAVMLGYDSEFNLFDLGATGTGVEWAEANLDASGSLKVAIGPECGSTLAFGHAEYRRFGRRLVYALADATERGLFPVQAIHQHAGFSRGDVISGYRTP